MILPRLDQWQTSTRTDHGDVHPIDAPAIFLREAQDARGVGEGPIPRLWWVGQDVLGRYAGDERPRRGDHENGRGVLHGHWTRQSVVPVDQAIRDGLADGELREVLELDLLPIGQGERGAVQSCTNDLHHPGEGDDEWAVEALDR